MAEPRVAQARRGQARGRRAGEPVAPAALDRRRRELLAALLLQERHDRILRAAGVGLVRGAGRGARGALWRPGARARRAPRDVGGGGGGGRGRRRCAAVDGPVPRARAAPAARRHLRARPPRGRAGRGGRRTARGGRRRARPSGPRVRGGHRAAGGARRGRQRRRADRRLSRLHARARRDARTRGARRAPLLAARGAPRVALVVRSRVRPRRRAARAHRPRALRPARAAARRADGRGLRAVGPDGRGAGRPAAPLGVGRRRRGDRDRGLRRLDAGVARLHLPLRRSPDRRGRPGRGRPRRLPRRARRLPRRRQPARPGPVRAATSRPRRHDAPHRRGGRAGRPPLARRAAGWSR